MNKIFECLINSNRVFAKKYLFLLFLPVAICLHEGCSKNNGSGKDITNTAAADLVAGIYKGSGKYLPGGLNLGNTILCTEPAIDYHTLYQTGDAAIYVTRITDSTVKIVFTAGPFPQGTYEPVTVKKNSSLVEFFQGSFDISSKTILFAAVAPNYAYSYSANCKIGLPQYTSALFPGPNGSPVYIHNTIKRYEFVGTKQ